MLLVSSVLSATETKSASVEQSAVINVIKSENSESKASAEQTGSIVESSAKDNHKDNSDVNYRISFRAAHERKNKHFMGSKNCSAISVNPIITVNDLTFDADFYYGRQFKNRSWLENERYFSKLVSNDKLNDFKNDFTDSPNDTEAQREGKKLFRDALQKPGADNRGEAHFYRNYARVMYEDKANNYRVVVGDTQVRNTIGFQNQFSGGGISIFRQGGNGNTINSGLPLVLTQVSKIKCKLGGETIACFILPAGQYTIDDLPPEAKMEGVFLEISDQTGRKEIIHMTYFSGYDHLKQGEDDFDFTIAFRHKWRYDDPHRIRYFSRPRLNTNYRRGLTDNITLALGAQAVARSFIFDGNIIFNTPYGKISPNVGLSHVSYGEYERKNHNKRAGTDDADYSIDKHNRTAVGAGIFYALPENSAGFHWETFGGIKGKGFSDLRIGYENQKMNNEFIDALSIENIPQDQIDGLKLKYRNSLSEETSKQFITRLYTNPVMGFVPSFVFSGNWSKSEKYRQFTVSLTKTWLGCTYTLSWGISYDAPHGGRNANPKDRRIMLSCCVPLNKEFEVSATYSTYADERKTAYGSVTYTPEAVKGLEICAERTKPISSDNPVLTVTYANEYFDVKAENNIFNANRHSDNFKHTTQQRVYFGTVLTNDGFKADKTGGFNLIRTAVPEKKSSSKAEKEYFFDELEKLDNKKSSKKD